MDDELEIIEDEQEQLSLFEDTEELSSYEDWDENGVEPKAKLGDVWILGSHRLMCGSSTDKNDVAKLLHGHKADLVVTDPPYNVDYEGKTKAKLKIQNDKFTDDQFFTFLKDAFENLNDNLIEGGAFYVWFASRTHIEFESALQSVGLSVREEIIWMKNVFTLGRQDYQWKHEPCLYGWKEGAPHKWYGGRCQSTILKFHKPVASKYHPTMKPIDLIMKLIENSSQQGEIVFDLFAGGGSTLLASELTKRRCFCMELDPHFVDVIIHRWEKMTGRKAVLEE